jgi:sulfur relay (sulfurtransferase) DsrC/TusE family protein
VRCLIAGDKEVKGGLLEWGVVSVVRQLFQEFRDSPTLLIREFPGG